MTVRVHKSTDGSAPILTGATGTLVALLDACLVNGFGANVALGWTKDFAGASMGVYRPPSGLRYYLDIDDAGPGAGTFKEARMRGYETMTALSTGTNLFPTVAQQTNGLFVRKSATIDATARPWYMVGDERTFYLAMQTGDVSATTYSEMSFGEFYSYRTGDLGRVFISGRATENSGTAGVEFTDQYIAGIGNTQAGQYYAREAHGAVGAGAYGKANDVGLQASGAGIVALTNPANGLVVTSQIRLSTNSPYNTVRGRYRGKWFYSHPIATAADRDTYTGQDDLTTRSFIIIKTTMNAGIFVYETSDTWDTN